MDQINNSYTMPPKPDILEKSDGSARLPAISVIIPAYNAVDTLGSLLLSLSRQTLSPDEIILVDDHSSDNTAQLARGFCKVITTERNSGAAVARNLGIRTAKGEVLAFIDSDCIAASDWIEKIRKNFIEEKTDLLMGCVKIPPSTYLGDSISALGFPGGGAIGFEKIWRVDPEGFTDHLTSCNFAIRKAIFEKYGMFDETFSVYCEDSELSFRLKKKGVRIRYCPEVVVYHKAQTEMLPFLKRNFKVGRANYLFKQKVGPVRSFIRLRIWSTRNILRTYYADKKFPLIFTLLFLSFVLQQIGFLTEATSRKIADLRGQVSDLKSAIQNLQSEIKR